MRHPELKAGLRTENGPPKQIIVPGDPGAYKRRKTGRNPTPPRSGAFLRTVTEQPDPDERRKCIRQHRQSAKRVDGERDPAPPQTIGFALACARSNA